MTKGKGRLDILFIQMPIANEHALSIDFGIVFTRVVAISRAVLPFFEKGRTQFAGRIHIAKQ